MSEQSGDETSHRPRARRPASTIVIGLLVGLCVLIGVALFAVGMAQMR